MSTPTYLIDTNVLIGLEDDKEVSPVLATLTKLAGKHGVKVAVHAAGLEDIERDKDKKRRKVTLSKFKKYDVIDKVKGLSVDELSAMYGDIKKPNDDVDCRLLNALKLGVVSVLVTEDEGIHKRARRYAPEISNSVLHIADAVSTLLGTYEPTEVAMRYVDDVEALTIKSSDPIFESLRSGYADFNKWWQTKCVKGRRRCWVVYDGNELAGVVVRKDEKADDTDAITPADKILKICTFKVREKSRGRSLGEHLMKQILWHAQQNDYDLAYVTTYKDQTVLIGLLDYYGFSQTSVKDDGELIYEKEFASTRLASTKNQSGFRSARLNYPRFIAKTNIPAFYVPIHEGYHDTLFPELAMHERDISSIVGYGSKALRPGNTIRKVYVCRAVSHLDAPGSMLFFYKCKSELEPSQAITTVGILENVQMAYSVKELSKLTGGRSVYTEAQLKEWGPTAKRPMKVINFLLHGYFKDPVPLKDLAKMGITKANPPQSISRIRPNKLPKLLARLDLGFEV